MEYKKGYFAEAAEEMIRARTLCFHANNTPPDNVVVGGVPAKVIKKL